jgi:hypothetical protein
MCRDLYNDQGRNETPQAMIFRLSANIAQKSTFFFLCFTRLEMAAKESKAVNGQTDDYV